MLLVGLGAAVLFLFWLIAAAVSRSSRRSLREAAGMYVLFGMFPLLVRPLALSVLTATLLNVDEASAEETEKLAVESVTTDMRGRYSFSKTVTGKIAAYLRRRKGQSMENRRRRLPEEVSWLRWHAAKVFSGEVIDSYDVSKLARIVGEGLSMGIVEVDWELFDVSDEVLADRSQCKEWLKRVEFQHPKIADICDIWSYALHGLLLDSCHIVWQLEELHALGRDLGVDAMLASYAEGVELEYIIG